MLTLSFNAFSQNYIDGLTVYKKMISSYKNKEKYDDKGVVINSYIRYGVPEKPVGSLVFRTKYLKGKRFEFVWSDESSKKLKIGKNSIVVENKNIVKILNGRKSHMNNINDALSAVGGVTDGVSYLIPAFLFGFIDVANIKHIELDKNILVDFAKYKLRVTLDHGGVYYYWLDENYLIRKYLSTISIKEGVLVNTEIIIRK